MKNKIFSVLVSAAIVLGAGFLSIVDVNAQSASYPAGCASEWGYSITSGNPCNGTNSATTSMAGCSSPLGYSTTNGEPCSGENVALSYLAGCSSVNGYSTINGAPCNGTTVATNGFVALSPSYVGGAAGPGLPTTGAGGEAPMNFMFMLISGTVAMLGATYLVSKERP